MPELPEVETVVRALRNAAIGRRIERVAFASRRVGVNNPRGWKARISGRSLVAVSRRGKYIIMGFDDDSALVIHLRMSGRLWLQPRGTPRNSHTRLILLLSRLPNADWEELRLVDTRQFARADWCPRGALESHPGLARLGPEANTLTPSDLGRILAGSGRPIKSLLLDQTRVSGLGNIYTDEALHRAGIHPLMPAQRIESRGVRKLQTAICLILDQAIKACGTSFDTFSGLSGQSGGFGPRLRVYGRSGLPCPTCGNRIERIAIGGRGTHVCPVCQPKVPIDS
jgi:formamidopyrimidine-DNA glycosylase